MITEPLLSPLLLSSSLSPNSVLLQLSYSFFVVNVVSGEAMCLILVTNRSMNMLPVAIQLQTVSLTPPETINCTNPERAGGM